MKKLALTFAIVLGLSLTTFADPNQGGLFQRGEATEPTPDAIYGIRTAGMPNLPTHNLSDNQDAPLGSGIALLLGLGGAYLVGKKRREE
ncbi:MAG: hypothetical protein IKH61_03660 [Bacteroidales bacterium]|nr:hypothetical protein [Bacteroidales bacterium]